MANQKIGVGPEGPIAGVIQLIALSVIGIVVFVYVIPLDITILKIMPATLIMLVALGQLSLLGDNFPFAPPAGNWNPERSRVSAGIRMTLIWVGFTAGSTAGDALYLSQMAYRAFVSLVRRDRILADPSLRHQLERLAFQG